MGKKRIPIKAARMVAEENGQQVTVLVTWERDTGVTHVVTYGETYRSASGRPTLGTASNVRS